MSAASRGIAWRTNVLLFFSSHSATVKDLAAGSNNRSLLNALRLDVHYAHAQNAGLAKAVRQLKAALLATGEFQRVFSGISPAAALTAQRRLVKIAPVLLSSRQMQLLRRRVSPAWINRRFASTAADIAAPDAAVQTAKLAADPFDIGGMLANRLRRLNPSQSARIGRGDILSADGRHALLILIPKVPPENIPASEAMLDRVHQAVRAVQEKLPGLRTWLIGPARNYVENARLVKADVTLVSIVGTLLVALAILVYFRRISTLVICMIPPVMGVGTALGIAGLLHLHLPLLVLAFAGLICGSTTDYGIQLLAAVNRLAAETGGYSPEHAALSARQLLGPISMSVATSVTGYAALMFSSAPGLYGLGLFVAGATLCIWIVTFLILPAFLGPWVIRSSPPLPSAGFSSAVKNARRWFHLTGLALFLVLTALLLVHAAQIRYSYNGRKIDGITASLHNQEHKFMKTWGNIRHKSVVLITSRHPATALTRLHRLDQNLMELQKDHLISSFQSPGRILPDAAVIKRRLTRWRNFWSPAHRRLAETWVSAAAVANGFRPAEFVNSVTELSAVPPIPNAGARLRQSAARLVPGPLELSNGRTTPRIELAVEVQSNRSLSRRMQTDWAGELRLGHPQVSILSGDVLFYNATARAQAEVENLFPWVALLIVLPMWLFFRRLDMTFVSAISMVCGFVWLLGAAEWFGSGLNLLSMVPLLFMMGVAVDYGIYAASDPAWRNGATTGKANRNGATFLCAITTFLGTAAMLAAGHPALRGIGLALAAGIAGGYLASYFLVGPLVCLLLRTSRNLPGKIVHYVAALSPRLAGLAIMVSLAALVIGQVIMFREKPDVHRSIPRWPVVQTAAQAWTCGPARLRRVHGVWDMHIGGTPEQMGYAASALGAPMDLRIENEMLDRMDTLVPNLYARWFLLRAVGLDMLNLPHYVPLDIQREIYAESLAHPDLHGYLMPMYPRLLAYHALDDISQNLVDNPLIDRHAVGCTGVIAKPAWSGDGHLWLARNFDFECGPAFNHQKSITFVRPNHGYGFATIAWPGLAGCVTGMNEKHIGLFINAAASASFRPVGEPTIIVARQVLQFASHIRQAIAMFRRAHVFVTNIIVVGNGRTGRAAVLEKSPAHFAWRYINSHTAVTNQLECPIFADDPVNMARIADSTSNQRLHRAKHLLDNLKGKVNEYTLAGLLRDKRSLHGRNIGWGNRNSIDALITTHSVIMDLTAGNIWIAAYPWAEGNYVGFPALKILKGSPGAGYKSLPRLPIVPADSFLTKGRVKKFIRSKIALTAGYKALAARNWNRAVKRADQAIADNPTFFGGYALRGRAELASGRYRAAAADLSHALAQYPPYAGRRKSLRFALNSARLEVRKK